MVISIAPDVFQEKMSMLFQDRVPLCMYMDNLVIISNGTYENHVDILDAVLKSLEKTGIQVNTITCKWPRDSVRYLLFLVTWEGIKTQPYKVKSIMGVEPPKTKCQLRCFIEILNLSHYLWRKILHTFGPLIKPLGEIRRGYGQNSSIMHSKRLKTF